jgi:succinate dehydrogenase/fumarate reductase flavoprotein subunit
MHGANRPGGDSLTETTVFGRRAGEDAGRHSRTRSAQVRAQAEVDAALADLDVMSHEGDEREWETAGADVEPVEGRLLE